MKTIYISLPISGHEDTYEQRLDEAVAWCKQNVVTTKQDDVVTPYGFGVSNKHRDIRANIY